VQGGAVVSPYGLDWYSNKLQLGFFNQFLLANELSIQIAFFK